MCLYIFNVYICDVCVCVCDFIYHHRVINLHTPKAHLRAQNILQSAESFTPLSMRLPKQADTLELRLGPAGTAQH